MAIAPLTQHDFSERLDRLGPFETAPHIAVAVSGGADSMALLLLAAAWAADRSGRVTALTVDHGLRAEAAAEAAEVARRCRARGIACETMRWDGDKPATGIQEAARSARYDLMTGWCRDRAVAHLLVAHHAGDQAETFLYRMGRGSGADGLAGMPAAVVRAGVRLLRPLLDVAPERL
ncbi:MAG: tRNA lysidine(34) synthetase TilS, partial [Alphaproteobacteria bacterium]